MKCIDAEKLYKKVDSLMAQYAILEEENEIDDEELSIFYQGKKKMCSQILNLIDSLQQEQPIQVNTLTWKDINDLERIINNVHYEFRNGISEKGFGEEVLERFREERDEQEQPDFPTTDEQIKEYLATHPKIEVPEKYKNPDWLFKKQEQPGVDLEKEYKEYVEDDPVFNILTNRNVGLTIARHFYNLGLNARKV